MTVVIEVQKEADAETIEVLVERAIRAQTGGLIRNLEIVSQNDFMLITGSTDLYYHKQLATRAAMEVSPEISLLNEIKVCS